MEVLIPVLSSETVPDLNLESFRVDFQSVFDPGFKGELFLQTSPELLMKRMLSVGWEKIFYLGPAFRQGELSARHHPEFTIIEWYQRGWNYFNLMEELELMLFELFGIKKPIARLTMQEAMLQVGGFDFRKFKDKPKLAKFLKSKIPGLTPEKMTWDELFERAWVEWVEPWLQSQFAIFIYDWPSQFSFQARLKEEAPELCERFELYLNGIEVANGYTEERDSEQLRKRFKAELRQRKKRGRKLVPLPERFLASIKQGFPECAGVSLGLERLVMALKGIKNLDEIMAFREI